MDTIPTLAYLPCGAVHKDYRWLRELKDINIIRTKVIDASLIDEIYRLGVESKLFFHVEISGLGMTPFEPNIPSVRELFIQLKSLLDRGFPKKRILIIIKPIIKNHNGLNALRLLLKLFTEFSFLRLSYVRFELLNYDRIERLSPTYKKLVAEDIQNFQEQYMILLNEYRNIITIDKGECPIVGVRELMPFGFSNNYKGYPIITYVKGRIPVFKNYLRVDTKTTTQCSNRCVLCPYKKY